VGVLAWCIGQPHGPWDSLAPGLFGLCACLLGAL
jgi:hypothetical protein